MKQDEAHKLFAYEHLPERLRDISQPFYGLAMGLFAVIPDHMGAYRTQALWKLWDAKNAAVAAVAQQ